MRWTAVGCAALALAAGAAACGDKDAETARAGVAATIPELEPPKELGAAALPLRPIGSGREGGSILLAKLGERRVALIADEDARALRVVDADTHEAISHAAVGGQPSQLALGSDGRVYVAVRDKSEVVSFEVTRASDAALAEVARIATAPEPVGLAMAGDELLVTSGWGRKLARYHVPTGAARGAVELAREPRGVAVTRDGRWAYVAHAVGSTITRIALGPAAAGELIAAPIALGGKDFVTDTFVPHRRPHPALFLSFLGEQPATRRAEQPQALGSAMPRQQFFEAPFIPSVSSEHKRHATQGFAVAIVGDAVAVPETLVNHGQAVSAGYGSSEGFPQQQPAIAMIEAGDDHATIRTQNRAWAAAKSRNQFEGGMPLDGCLLPRAAAGDETGRAVLVSCLGRNQVMAFQAKVAEPLLTTELARWNVASGPSGIAVDEARREAFVWSQFDATLSTLDLPEPGAKTRPLPSWDGFVTPPLAPKRATDLPAIAQGEASHLSEAALRGRKLFHASGDPRMSGDGRACASCHPDGREDGLTWPSPNGPRQTPMLVKRIDDGVAPFGWDGAAGTVPEHLKLTFSRLGGTGVTGQDLEDLLAYVRELPAPPRETADPRSAARGKELFHSELVGCSSCHVGGEGSDGARHDVGGGVALDTPSLRFIGGTGPYYHDGRFATLGDLLRKTKGVMGWAGDMKDDDLSAIEAYLRTL